MTDTPGVMAYTGRLRPKEVSLSGFRYRYSMGGVTAKKQILLWQHTATDYKHPNEKRFEIVLELLAAKGQL